jgi:hypothetical protein
MRRLPKLQIFWRSATNDFYTPLRIIKSLNFLTGVLIENFYVILNI